MSLIPSVSPQALGLRLGGSLRRESETGRCDVFMCPSGGSSLS